MTITLVQDDCGDRNDFDPIAEGARHQLASETSIELWDYVARLLADYGSRDEHLNRQCFREAAARIARRRKRAAEEEPAPASEP
jgi:hypothetical protein